MNIDELTYKIRGVIFEVHNELGPGLLETVYEAALLYEFKSLGLSALSQIALPVPYKSVILEIGFRIDILVEDQVIIEVKSIEQLQPIHKKQVLNYLRLTGKRVGFLVNFNTETLDKDALVRLVNNY